jgi:hypothetical protein
MKEIAKIARTRYLSKRIKIDIKGCIKWRSYVFVFLLIACGKPDQPPGAKKETVVCYLGSKFKAKVTREIDVMMLGRFYQKGKRGGYWINIELPCDSLLAFDVHNMQKNTYTLAGKLYFDVSDGGQKINAITIAFNRDTSSASYQSKFFEYKVDTLRSY